MSEQKPSLFKTLQFKVFGAMASSIVAMGFVIAELADNMKIAKDAHAVSMRTRSEWIEYKLNNAKSVTSAVQDGMSGVNQRLDSMNRAIGELEASVREINKK